MRTPPRSFTSRAGSPASTSSSTFKNASPPHSFDRYASARHTRPSAALFFVRDLSAANRGHLTKRKFMYVCRESMKCSQLFIRTRQRIAPVQERRILYLDLADYERLR